LPKFGTYISYFAGLLVFISALFSIARPATRINSKFALQVQEDSVALDSLAQDSIKSYQPSFKPVYNFKDRFGDPFSHSTNPSPLFLKDPSSLTLDAEIDTGMNYTIYEKIGDLHYRPTTTMTFEEFDQYQEKEMIQEYWKNRSGHRILTFNKLKRFNINCLCYQFFEYSGSLIQARSTGNFL